MVDWGHLLRDALWIETVWERDESDEDFEGGDYVEGAFGCFSE